MKEMSKTKKRVFEAAVTLFNTNGYSGTSVRDIASKAGVNVSMISYYFGGKKGLLEYIMTTFLEDYISIIEQAYEKHEIQSIKQCLLDMVKDILEYEANYYHVARLVHREITLDTLLIREIMTTYLTKERYYLKFLFETGMRRNEFRKLPVMMTILLLKGMLTMPYLHPQYMVEVLHIQPQERFFTDRYFQEIKQWIEGDLCMQTQKRPPLLLPIAKTI